MPDNPQQPKFETPSPLKPAGKPTGSPLQVQKTSDLDAKWQQWSKTRKPEHFNELMTAANPILDKAITSYAPKSSPAVRSQAKILAKKAFASYDPKKGAKLQTHLYTQLQPLQREAGSYDTLHVPEGVRFDIRHVNEAHNRFVEESGREPSDDELADYTGLSKKRLSHVRKLDMAVIGESSLMPEDDDADSDIGMPETQQHQSAWRDMIYMELSDPDKLMYDLKLGRNGRKPLGVSEIAKKFKISPGAVSQRLAKIDQRINEGEAFKDIV